MNHKPNVDKHSPAEPKTDRQILELQIEQKLVEAREALRFANQTELERIAKERHEPKFQRTLSITGVAIALLIAGNLWQMFGLTDRIKQEAGRIIDHKLIDPQLTITLDEALSKKAIPLIAVQLRPIETNVAVLKADLNVQAAHFGTMSLDISNKQAQLTSDQMTIREQLFPLSNRIASLQSSLDAAQAQAKKLEGEQHLMGLLNRGELFDKTAVQELQIIAQGTNEIALLAQAMFNKVQRTLLIDRTSYAYLSIAQGTETNQYSGPFTTDELATFLVHPTDSGVEAVVNMLGKQPMFVSKLVELAHQSKDLWTINRISKALNAITGISFYPWDLKPLDSWWAQNSGNYTNWPFNQYEKGLEAIRACSYAQALTNLEYVLTIDSSADKTRALAVASAIEIGNTLKAQQLNANYAISDGRWAKWAQGKMMLATNDIQAGTEKFVSLSKQYPYFPQVAWIAPGNHILRQVDWVLYSKLMQTTNNAVSVGPK